MCNIEQRVLILTQNFSEELYNMTVFFFNIFRTEKEKMQAHFKILLSYANVEGTVGKKAADLHRLASGVLRVTLLLKIP